MARRSDDVIRELLDAVVGGEYREGDWLPSEPDLRARFGGGRGVLREALRSLQDRGLVVVRPGRGQQVLHHDHWDTRDPAVLRACVARGPQPAILAATIDARGAVEQLAALRAIEHATDADLSQLGDRIEEMERALAPGAARTNDASDPLVIAEAWFHQTLALLSQNPQLAKLVEPLQLVLAELRRAWAPARDRSVVRHHRRILEALSSREDELAVAAVGDYARQLADWLRVRR